MTEEPADKFDVVHDDDTATEDAATHDLEDRSHRELMEDLAEEPHDDADATTTRWQWVVPLTAAILAVAVVFLVVSALSWWGADHDRGLSDAAARDAVLSQARIDVATLNTVDYHDPTGSLQRWSAVTTASLHQQITQGLPTVAKEIAAAKVSTTGLVVAAAVTNLDVDHGSATVIASVQLTKTPDTGTSVVDRNRVKATFTRVGSTWKLADLSTVAVQLR